VHANNFDVTPRLRKYAEDKVSKLSRYFNGILKADVEFTEEAKGRRAYRRKVEITLSTGKHIMRAEVIQDDYFSAVDSAVNKLERQLKKYKKKLIEPKRSLDKEEIQNALMAETLPAGVGLVSTALQEQASETFAPTKEDALKIVRTKTFTTKPMSSEEAILQLELSGHPFFIFMNAETNQINLLYKRRLGGYGLLVPSDE